MVDTTKYAGKQFYALVARMGGKFTTIYALAVYEFRSNGVPFKVCEALNCVANKAQFGHLKSITEDCGYISGRPTKERMSALTKIQLDKLIG